MVSSLLSQLAANAHRTPDQIAAALRPSIWMKGSDIPQDVWVKWHDADAQLAIGFYRNPDTWSFFGCDFNASSWGFQAISTGHLQNHYFALAEHYNEHISQPEYIP